MPVPNQATTIPSTSTTPTNTPVSADTMRRWNKMIDFAKQKGYSGQNALDHNEDLRKQVFDEYNKANPNDTLQYPDVVKPVQNEIQNYKAQALAAIQKNSGKLDNGVSPNSFMATISPADGVFGSKTSSWKFPNAYQINNGVKKELGFAPKVNLTALNK